MATRGRPPGLPKTGGRVRGKSLDKGERQLVTSQMAGDLLAVYRKLGGVKWLLKFAEDNPAEFIRQGLSRLFPAPQKDDADFVQNNTQVNIHNLSDREAAVRVAYALSKAVYDSEPAQEQAVIEHEPEQAYSPNAWQPPSAPRLTPKEPEPLDEDHQRWINELPLTDEQRRDNAICRETKECTISNYRGGAGEQPGTSVQRPAPARKPSAGELCRRLSRRSELL